MVMSEDVMEEQQKKAMLVVSFGTSHADTREKNIDRIEKDICAAFPDYRFYRAWTSKMILKKLKNRDGIVIDTVKEAMERMAEDGIREVIVQPTHVMNGIENDQMTEDVRACEARFERIRIGAPLLTTEQDSRDAIAALAQEWGTVPEDEALVLMGHGTEHYANTVYAALDYMMKDLGYKNMFLGTVEAYPTLEALIRQVKKINPVKVHLSPFMIVAGDHAKNDMSGEAEDSWASCFLRAGFDVECHLKGLGEYPQIREIFVRHAREAK